MFFKLSFENVKRSFKDYAIFFMTITLAICIFYSFNTLDVQMQNFTSTDYEKLTFKEITNIMQGLSIFVSALLFLIILYGNLFLWKLRKKEFGIYRTLGLGRYALILMLMIETIVLSLISLMIGIGLGIFISQILSLLIADMLNITIISFDFLFSWAALQKTVLYFGIIYSVAGCCSILFLQRYNLIQLIKGVSEGEKLRLKNLRSSIILFILAVSIILWAYFIIWTHGFSDNLKHFWVAIRLGLAGTLLFYFILPSFFSNIFSKIKILYLNNINLFIIRHWSNKTYSNFFSIAVISLVIAIAITSLTVGFTIKRSFELEIHHKTPYDATLYVSKEGSDGSSEKATIQSLNLEDYGRTAFFTLYETIDRLPIPTEDTVFYKEPVLKIITYDDYRNSMELQGNLIQKLQENEMIVLVSNDENLSIIKDLVKQKQPVRIANQDYVIKGYQYTSVYTTGIGPSTIIAVVRTLPTNLSVFMYGLNIQYEKEKKTIAEAYLQNIITPNLYKNTMPSDVFIHGFTKKMVVKEVRNISTVLVFSTIYLGVIFLLSCTGIIGLQQLAEVTDHVKSYQVLKQLGVSRKIIRRSIAQQIITYFALTLVLAVPHAFVTSAVILRNIFSMSISNSIMPFSMVVVVVLLIYIIYLLFTYRQYKRIIN